MSASNKTPAPWSFDQYGHVYGTAAPKPHPTYPSATVTDHPHVCTPKNAADIPMISAAPKMMEALRELIIAAEAAGWDADAQNAPILNAARVALAEANGKFA